MVKTRFKFKLRRSKKSLAELIGYPSETITRQVAESHETIITSELTRDLLSGRDAQSRTDHTTRTTKAHLFRVGLLLFSDNANETSSSVSPTFRDRVEFHAIRQHRSRVKRPRGGSTGRRHDGYGF